jgi:hypothetical protein
MRFSVDSFEILAVFFIQGNVSLSDTELCKCPSTSASDCQPVWNETSATDEVRVGSQPCVGPTAHTFECSLENTRQFEATRILARYTLWIDGT